VQQGKEERLTNARRGSSEIHRGRKKKEYISVLGVVTGTKKEEFWKRQIRLYIESPARCAIAQNKKEGE